MEKIVYIRGVIGNAADDIKNVMTLIKQNEQGNIEQALQAIGPKRVLNLAECCALTGYSRGHVYRLTSSRRIPHYKRGKMVLFSKDELEKWLMENRIATVSELEAAAGAYLVTGRHPKK